MQIVNDKRKYQYNAAQSRATAKPCAEKLHARFDEGRQALGCSLLYLGRFDSQVSLHKGAGLLVRHKLLCAALDKIRVILRMKKLVAREIDPVCCICCFPREVRYRLSCFETC